MSLLRFKPEDLPVLNGWYAARGHQALELNSIPQIGYIEPGVAAGFLFITDSNIAFTDLFISNPEAKSTERVRAVYAILDQLSSDAKACGFKYVAGIVSTPGARKLCERQGFTRQSSVYEMLTKEV